MKRLSLILLLSLFIIAPVYADSASVKLADTAATTGDGFFINLPVTYSCDVAPGITDPRYTSFISSLFIRLLQKQNLPKKGFNVASGFGALSEMAICDGQEHTKNIIINTQCCVPFVKGLADASVDFKVSVLDSIGDFCPPSGCSFPIYRDVSAPPVAASVNIKIVRN